MKLTSVWTSIVYFFDTITFQNAGDRDGGQAPLNVPLIPEEIVTPHIPEIVHEVQQPPHSSSEGVQIVSVGGGRDDGRVYTYADGTPIIPTPHNPQEGGDRITCEYPEMKAEGWESCYGPDSRGCWLRNTRTKAEINILTDYEDPYKVPNGTVREFTLVVGEQPIWPDGVTMEHGKVFNRTYPGPWIEACWGDTVRVKVINNLKWNGTSVHWHGIRQLGTNQHDGVNGITECPIAPGDSFVYEWKALQYGSAWYHSHYSLQYGDGMLGPMTIHGPSTANFGSDLSFRPILITDWNHRSVFEDWPLMLSSDAAPEMTNILVNGTGQFGPGSTTANKYQITLEPKKSHMLILINTAVDTTFVFSIDNHTMTVIEADFVPIEPYTTTNLKIGIGQRYHVIINGLENPYGVERNGNFWMRTIPARKCSKFAFGPDQQTGIVRYNPDSPRNAAPLSEPYLFDIGCWDEPYEKLRPWKPWTVGDPVNIDPTQMNHSALPWNKRYIYDVHRNPSRGPPYVPDDKAYYRWSMHEAPFRINFSDPVVMKVEQSEQMIKQAHLDIITYDNKKQDAWIWMVMTAPDILEDGARQFIPAAHPMHLHGHDFALIAQSSWPWYDTKMGDGRIRKGAGRNMTPDKLNCKNPYINCNNPPRRDVVLLPAGGYAIIAFKADNPGAWILHCHIAFHASSGLAIQILENKHRIEEFLAKDRPMMEQSCKRWNEWVNNPMNHWDWQHPSHFQDDSGV